jgi:opine dehydrogenase
VMEAAAPHIRPGQVVIISSLCSLSALYLSRLLAGRGVEVPIATWGTTVLTARRRSGTEVAIMTVRTSLHVATLPVSQAAVGLETCRTLFGDRFIEQSDVLATSLININPVAHFGLALCNLTRIERGENWPQYHYMTDAVSRLITTLDHERLAVASAFGLKIHPIEEHFHRSFDVPVGDLADIARTIHARRGGPPGPTTLDTRFVHEDVPYGLVFAEAIGKIAGVDTTVHSAGITVISAIYGRDFRAENDLLPVLGLEGLSKEELLRRAREGWPAATA